MAQSSTRASIWQVPQWGRDQEIAAAEALLGSLHAFVGEVLAHRTLPRVLEHFVDPPPPRSRGTAARQALSSKTPFRDLLLLLESDVVAANALGMGSADPDDRLLALLSFLTGLGVLGQPTARVNAGARLVVERVLREGRLVRGQIDPRHHEALSSIAGLRRVLGEAIGAVPATEAPRAGAPPPVSVGRLTISKKARTISAPGCGHQSHGVSRALAKFDQLMKLARARVKNPGPDGGFTTLTGGGGPKEKQARDKLRKYLANVCTPLNNLLDVRPRKGIRLRDVPAIT